MFEKKDRKQIQKPQKKMIKNKKLCLLDNSPRSSLQRSASPQIHFALPAVQATPPPPRHQSMIVVIVLVMMMVVMMVVIMIFVVWLVTM